MAPIHTTGALPTFLVIGAMKCGTTALHGFLAGHPEVGMAEPKELNFFFGDGLGDWHSGNWRRGLGWYRDHFDAALPARGEASPGYTSPAHPEAAERIAASLPGVRLVYLVRDPLARALSQFRHHACEGAELRRAGEALLDPASQYVARSRYHDRVAPFLGRMPQDRVFVAAQEELVADRDRTLRALFGFLGVDDGFRPAPVHPPANGRPGGVDAGDLPPFARERFAAAVADDADRLRALAGRDFPGWTV